MEIYRGYKTELSPNLEQINMLRGLEMDRDLNAAKNLQNYPKNNNVLEELTDSLSEIAYYPGSSGSHVNGCETSGWVGINKELSLTSVNNG